MSDRVREFVLAGSDGRLEPIVVALEPSFAVVRGSSRRVRRSWLDSFDWRLYRAGLVLEQRRGRAASELVLSTAGGEVIAVWPGVVKTPGLLDGSAGSAGSALGERVGPLLGARALLEVADATVTLREMRLLNADEKTVARVSVEVACTGETDVSRVVVTPLRGYESQALRAERLIAAIPGTVVAAGSRLDSALTARGRRTGDYTGKIELILAGSAPPTASVAVVLLSLLDSIEANLDGVLRDIDSEFLHDMRVAVRRVRSGLKLVGDVLPAGVSERFGSEFKWLAALTSPVRDLDVYLLDIVGHAEGAAGAALAPFNRMLEERHRIERRKLVAGLRSARFASMRTQSRETLSALTASRRVIGPARTVGELAAARIGRAHKRLLKRGAAITAASPAEELHDLRKRCKELRTLLDMFASVYDAGVLSAVTKELKSLQDCLGNFQDSEVQADGVVTFAEQMMTGSVPVATLLAMGALTERLDVRRRAARAHFAVAFARFTSEPNAKRMRVLTRAAQG